MCNNMRMPAAPSLASEGVHVHSQNESSDGKIDSESPENSDHEVQEEMHQECVQT